jgi:hypothetical protein
MLHRTIITQKDDVVREAEERALFLVLFIDDVRWRELAKVEA